MKLRFRLWPWLVCAVLGGLAFFLKFCIPGYSFSALVCCCLIAVILFYEGTRLLLPRYPKVLRPLRWVFTACLCLCLLVVGATEAVIIGASCGSPNEQVDYIVVLGAKVREDGPSVSLWDRIYAAEDYLKAHPKTIAILSGGQGLDEPMPEAMAMCEELNKLGISRDRLWMEDQATSTWENLNYSLNIIENVTGQRPEKIGVLSSEYHLFRASLFARECGVEFVGIPATTSRPGQRINHFMREIAGVWHFLLLGGQYD